MKDGFHYIRKAAADLISSYEAEAGTPVFSSGDAVHTKLPDIIRRVLKYDVSTDYDLPDGAMGRLDLENRVIGFSEALTPLDRIFTIAHEAGHCALGHTDGPYVELREDVDDSPDQTSLAVRDGVYPSYSAKSRQELEANCFAIELLAPVREVRKRLEGPSWTVEELARFFGLSRTAMLNQIVASMVPLPDEEDLPIRVEAPTIEDETHERAINVATPTLVEAGPGSGKTRVLVSRYERLVRSGTKPREILALTFANKAAAEMRERLAKRLPEQADEIVVTTFHSLGLDLIRRHWNYLGRFTGEPRLASPADVLSLLKRNLSGMPLGEFEDLSAPGFKLGLLLDAVSRAKDEMLGPQAFSEKCDVHLAEVLQEPMPEKGAEAIQEATRKREHAAKCVDAARFYKAYDDLLARENLLDYGDLIMLATRLVEETPARGPICKEFRYLLVDEFQDVNRASGKLVKALDDNRDIVWAVGDVRQSIYRFRGASPTNLLNFKSDYPMATTVQLGRNYRSVKDIVASAACVEMKSPKTGETLPGIEVEAYRGRPEAKACVHVFAEASLESELERIVRIVQGELLQKRPPSDLAILCRSKKDASRVAEALETVNIGTSWAGDPLASWAFKDVLAVVATAAGDIRGLERALSLPDHFVSAGELLSLTAWRREKRLGVFQLLRDAKGGLVPELSDEAAAACGRLLLCAQSLAHSRWTYPALASYLFEGCSWCRSLFMEDSSRSRRAMGAIRQALLIARSFDALSDRGEGRLMRSFLDFIETAIESGRLGQIAPDLGDPRLVNVMTVHASKGLEWPVVIVPFLTEGKFPARKSGERTPIPPNLSGEFALDGDRAEEASLFFVALTRGRDRLYLTRAPYNRNFNKPSHYLQPVIDGLAHLGYLTLEEAEVSEDVKDSDQEEEFDPRKLFDYSELSEFGRCPKRYEYERVLGLSGGDKGYLRYHRVVEDVVEWLRERHGEGLATSPDDARNELESRWRESGPVDHYYESRYFGLAKAAIEVALRRTSLTGIEVDKLIEIDANGRRVQVSVDEYEQGPPVVFRKVHLTRPRKSHLGKDDDDRHALYAIYAEQNLGETPWRIEAFYPALDETRMSQVVQGMKGPLLKFRKLKMLRLSREFEERNYTPEANLRSCRRCPYNIVCPVSDEEEDAVD